MFSKLAYEKLEALAYELEGREVFEEGMRENWREDPQTQGSFDEEERTQSFYQEQRKFAEESIKKILGWNIDEDDFKIALDFLDKPPLERTKIISLLKIDIVENQNKALHYNARAIMAGNGFADKIRQSPDWKRNYDNYAEVPEDLQKWYFKELNDISKQIIMTDYQFPTRKEWKTIEAKLLDSADVALKITRDKTFKWEKYLPKPENKELYPPFTATKFEEIKKKSINFFNHFFKEKQNFFTPFQMVGRFMQYNKEQLIASNPLLVQIEYDKENKKLFNLAKSVLDQTRTLQELIEKKPSMSNENFVQLLSTLRKCETQIKEVNQSAKLEIPIFAPGMEQQKSKGKGLE